MIWLPSKSTEQCGSKITVNCGLVVLDRHTTMIFWFFLIKGVKRIEVYLQWRTIAKVSKAMVSTFSRYTWYLIRAFDWRRMFPILTSMKTYLQEKMEVGFNCEIQIFTKNIPLGEKKSNLDFLRQKKQLTFFLKSWGSRR